VKPGIYKRKTVLINKNLQLRFIAWVFITNLIFIFSASLGILIINTGEMVKSRDTIAGNMISITAQTSGDTTDESAVKKLEKEKKSFLMLELSKENMKTNILKIFVFSVIISLFVIFILFLQITHRIAGPVYRFGRTLEAVKNGDLTQKIFLRKNDEMKGLAELFNSSISLYNSKIKNIKELAGEIKNDPAAGKIIRELEFFRLDG